MRNLDNIVLEKKMQLRCLTKRAQFAELCSIVDVLDDEYRLSMLDALIYFCRKGRNTVWPNSLVMTRLFSACKRILGAEADGDDDFDFAAYHRCA